jgi:hypothetical protein
MLKIYSVYFLIKLTCKYFWFFEAVFSIKYGAGKK